MGPELGKYNLNATQQCNQIFSIWQTLSMDGDMFEDIPHFRDLINEDRIRDIWLCPAQASQKLSASTLQVYTYSLDAFLKFLVQQKFELPSGVNDVRAATNRWRIPLARQKRQRRIEKLTMLESQLIAPATFQRTFSHPYVLQLEGRLRKFNGVLPGEKMNNLWRASQGYLILRMACMNGQRNGALRHMTVAEVKNVHVEKDEDGVTISVTRHKTAGIAPARISLFKVYYEMLLGFLDLREAVIGRTAARDKSLPVFLKMWYGRPIKMDCASVDKAVKSVWSKAGNPPSTIPLSLTLIRKSVTTTVRRAKPTDLGFRGRLANHMNHSVRTADIYYEAVESSGTSFPTMRTISETMQMDTRRRAQKAHAVPASASTSVLPGNSDSDDPDRDIVPGPICASTPVRPVSPDPDDTDDNEDPLAEADYSWRPKPPARRVRLNPQHRRRFFSGTESSALLRLTKAIVLRGAGGGSITQSECTATLESTDEGRHLLLRLSQRTFSGTRDVNKVIADKVRSAAKELLLQTKHIEDNRRPLLAGGNVEFVVLDRSIHPTDD
jgi:hypothetical protein